MVQFIDQPEPVIALAGSLLLEEDARDPGTVEMVVADGVVQVFPAETRPYLEYLVTPRHRRDVITKLADHDPDPDALVRELLDAGLIIEVPQSSARDALAAFEGLRVVPQAVPADDDGPAGSDGLVRLTMSKGDPRGVMTSVLLADSIFLARPDEDLPTAVGRIGRETGLDGEPLARQGLFGLGGLIGNGLARLERVAEPQ